MEKNNEKDLINYQKDEKNFDLKVNINKKRENSINQLLSLIPGNEFINKKRKKNKLKNNFINNEKQQEPIKENKKEKLNLNILKQSNENNFEIKSEYYYIEEEDSKVPYIFEKTIKKIIKNQPNKQFKEVIEKNELTILSKNKKNKYNEIYPEENLKSLKSDKSKRK